MLETQKVDNNNIRKSLFVNLRLLDMQQVYALLKNILEVCRSTSRHVRVSLDELFESFRQQAY